MLLYCPTDCFFGDFAHWVRLIFAIIKKPNTLNTDILYLRKKKH